MLFRKCILFSVLFCLLSLLMHPQQTPWFQWTFLPAAQMDEIVGESSGETAFNHTLAMAGFNRDRQPEEYKTTFLEAQYVLGRPGTVSRGSFGKFLPTAGSWPPIPICGPCSPQGQTPPMLRRT